MQTYLLVKKNTFRAGLAGTEYMVDRNQMYRPVFRTL